MEAIVEACLREEAKASKHRPPPLLRPCESGVCTIVAMAKAVLQNQPAKKKAGRPQKRCHRPFACPVAGCDLSYRTGAGLHQHKRNKHPELIQARGSHGSGLVLVRKFACPVEGCDKSYDTSQGMYQHKSSKHPELIKRR